MPRSSTSKPTPRSRIATRFLPMSCMSPGHSADQHLAALPVAASRKMRRQHVHSGGHRPCRKQHLGNERGTRRHAVADDSDRRDQAALEDFRGRNAGAQQVLDVPGDVAMPALEHVLADRLERVVRHRRGSIVAQRGRRARVRSSPARQSAGLQRQSTLLVDALADALQPREHRRGRNLVGDADHDAIARRDGAEELVHVGLEVGLAGLRRAPPVEGTPPSSVRFGLQRL